MTCESELILYAAIAEIQGLFGGATVHKGNIHSYLDMMLDFTNEGSVSVKVDGYVEDVLDVTGTAKSPAHVDLFEIDEAA